MIFANKTEPSDYSSAMLLTTFVTVFAIMINFEVPQMKYYRRKYFEEDDNLLDLMQALNMVALVVVHFTSCFGQDDITTEVTLRYLQIFFMFINLTKWCVFARCVESLQSNIYLIVRSVGGMMSFTGLLLFFSLCFSLMYIGARVDVPGYDSHTGDDDFPQRSVFERFFMYGLSNTVGDISLPGFDHWDSEDGARASNPKGSSAMIALGLGINYIQIMFMVVVIFNLLIAVISE